ncbi:alpha/beta fold hydrolase [Nocardioides bruguierae]|uniref:alpha/beta fold hydrolase n=1 Tax=Nocardioides bruguierae TaxID=2945102 RepID=UPI002022464F|nr:alpha/beta hydrolase [Nocardioides bruguierae]MCL8026582.1 alpha/beta hydrolase [Nocardioides bruguierae]
MPEITTNDVTLHYTDTAPEQATGNPVVLIHGWPLSGEAWKQQVPTLVAAGHRVVTYDRRGFGASSKPDGGYDYDTMADDLAGLLEALDLTDVTLVGFSMGGGEVARYVGRHGEGRLRSVVLAAAVPPYLLRTDDNPDGGLSESDVQEMEDGARTNREEFLAGFTENFFSVDGELRVSSNDVADAVALQQPARDEAVVACIGAFARTDFREDLARITVPTLVLHGSSDAVVPFEVSGRRSAEAVAGAELVVVEGAPHGFNVSHAEEFDKALVDFLAH